MKEGLAEFLIKASKFKTEKERIASLKKSNEITDSYLLTALRLMFDKEVAFDLPPGDPPYEPAPKESDLQGYLYSEFRRLRYFVKGQHPEIKPAKRESLFIEFLESMDPDDAKLLLAIKDKKSPYKGVTKNLVKKTFKEAKDW